MPKNKNQQVGLIVLFIFTGIGLLDYFVPGLDSSSRLLYIFILIALVSLVSFLISSNNRWNLKARHRKFPQRFHSLVILLCMLWGG